MRTLPRAVRLTQHIAQRLGLDDPGAAWREDLRRLHLPEESAADLAEAIVESGRRCGVAFLRQSYAAAEFRSAMRDVTAPLAIVAQQPTSGVCGAVVDAVDGDVAIARILTTDGIGEQERFGWDALFERLAGSSGVVGVLFPAKVLPEAVLGPSADAADRTPMERLWELLVLEKGNIGLVYAYATLVGLFSLTLPLGVQAIIGLVSGGLFLQPIVILIAFVILGTAATGVLQVLQLSAVERIQQRIFARIALEFSLRVPRVSVEQWLKDDLPERMNRFFEVVTIQKSLGKLLTGATTALLQVLFGLLLLTFYHYYFTFFWIGMVVLLWGVLKLTYPKGLETSLMESKFKYRAVHWLEELARTVASFKAAGRATPALARMDEHVSGYLKYRQKHFKVLVWQALSAVGLKALITGSLLIIGSVLVIQGQITLGQFVAAELVVVTVLAGVEKLVDSLDEVYDLLTAVYKLGGVTDLPLEPVGGLTLPDDGTGIAVKLQDVSYSYPAANRPALSGISLDVRPGGKVAITGSDGAGSSTVLGIVAGLLPHYGGVVQVGGITLRDVDPATLRDRIGLVLGPGEVFEGSVEENVSLGRAGISTADVMRALEAVGAADDVQALALGLRTPLASGGRGLPSTLRVRLLIARAIVARPRLIVLDEVLATVEPAARHELIQVLTGPNAPWTLFIVSHDPEVFASVETVLVLRDGVTHAAKPWKDLASDIFVRELVPSSRSVA
ncbi:ATP-binding cassette domain-containing protein [Pseudogemmatithrix spongiicola]|uniref:ATP-binding cassette domain-containing protein n=1 Tax=Pseudogemmatithrix spongiicola TaxID=3062599 RepID=A0AA49Q996_9BACT|nr:ATP-binding cassette domain-containing protein [Gemmatimonadaceae bacterium 'strain 138']WKW15960.1 ATP-binding cassette domain-containing protein [Gemmatimonadaceae bacterium 'strain 318']